MQKFGSGYDQLDKMREGVEYSFPVRLRAFEVYLRPLSVIEHVQALEKVAEAFSKLPPMAQTSLAQGALLARTQLESASKPDIDKPAVLTGLLLDKMTVEEILHLFKQYTAIVDRVNPDLEHMAPDAIDELIESVKKKAGNQDLALALIECSSSEWFQIALHLTRRSEQPTGSSSGLPSTQ